MAFSPFSATIVHMATFHATALIRSGKELSWSEQLRMVLQLSFPAIMSHISSIVMQYADAAMVGRLGAADSASIGLVSSSTWLFGGLCTSIVVGFSVQVAQAIGAKEDGKARNLMKEGILVSLAFSFLLLFLGWGISSSLPGWLGGEEAIRDNASSYFLVYALALPFMQLNAVSSSMLQSSGNMKVPSILNILMCCLNILFNSLFIFSSGVKTLFGLPFWFPGLGLGVTGAALATMLSQAVISLLMVLFLLFHSPLLGMRKGERIAFSAKDLKAAVKLSIPVGFEQVVMSGAMVATTRIISPLGTIAIAANSFAITAEGLCYMPGYGIAEAAATLVGQAYGAGRKKLARQLGWMSTGLGMLIMTCTGILLYTCASSMMAIFSPDAEIVRTGAEVLRIEAFAEPFFAASIVASGVLRGAGDTFVPSLLNFLSMWCVRIPLALILVPKVGLKGAWIAMCGELCVRGLLFLIRQKWGKWLDRNPVIAIE